MLSDPSLLMDHSDSTGGRALVVGEPRDLIARFESEPDLQMRQDEALGLLRTLHAHESEDLVVRVGTAWAHILQADRSHLLRDALGWVERSRSSVAQLEASAQAASDPLAAYVIARWHAAAGRIRCRYGDARAAHFELTIAAKRCTRKDLWFLRPEILSTLLRVRVDETARIGTPAAMRTAVRRFSTLRDVMNRLAARRGIDLGAIMSFGGALVNHVSTGAVGPLGVSREQLEELIGVCDADEERRRCEMVRGLITLHFNRALLFVPDPKRGWVGDLERSRDIAGWCARAAFAIGDRYRLTQALRHIDSLGAPVARGDEGLQRLRRGSRAG